MRGLFLYILGYYLGNDKFRLWVHKQASHFLKEKKDDDVSKTD